MMKEQVVNNNENTSVKRQQRRTILAHGVDELGPDVNFSHTQHMIAGAMAGVVEHAFMFPVDTIKTRMQSSLATSRNAKMMEVMKSIRSEGNLRLYSGLSAVLVGAVPSHALYFATYEFAKDCLHNRRIRTSSSDPSISTANAPPNTPVVAVAAVMATMVHDAISTPMDVIKQRMQLNAQHKSILSCFRYVMKKEGLKAFYISYPTTLLMNIPYTMVHFIAYETFKYLLHYEQHHEHDDHDDDHDDHDHHHEHKEQMWKHFVAGGMSGALAAAVSNPVDVIKTRLQTQGPSEYTGVRDAMKKLVAEEGMSGFWRGVAPRMLYHAPSAAITWATYEYMKVLFKQLGI